MKWSNKLNIASIEKQSHKLCKSNMHSLIYFLNLGGRILLNSKEWRVVKCSK